MKTLSKEVWNLILFNTMMSTIFSFTAIFVNLYFWGKGQNMLDVTLFNLVQYLFIFVAYMIGSYYLYKRDIRFVMTWSCCCSALCFLSLYFGNSHDRYLVIVIVGLLAGSTQGLYWGAQNSAIYFFLKSEDYPHYFSAITILSQLVSILVPILSSAVIYELDFKYAFLVLGFLSLSTVTIAMRLPHFSVEKPLFRHIQYKTIFSQPGTRWSFPLVTATGALTQFQSFFSMIFIFDITHNEFLVALLNVGYSIILFGALAVYRKINANDNLWLILGITLILVAYAIALTSHPSLMILIVLLMQVGTLYFSASNGRQSYRLMMQGDIVWRTKVGIWMELALVIPRLVILSIALLVHHVGDAPFIILVGVTMLSMVCIPYFQYKSVYEFEQVRGRGAGM